MYAMPDTGAADKGCLERPDAHFGKKRKVTVLVILQYFLNSAVVKYI